jgi:hypothetical protein
MYFPNHKTKLNFINIKTAIRKRMISESKSKKALNQ